MGFGQQSKATTSSGKPLATEISNLQKAAAWAYFFSLVYALALWGFHDKIPTLYKDPNPDIVIITLGQAILGLFGGALAVILNVDNES